MPITTTLEVKASDLKVGDRIHDRGLASVVKVDTKVTTTHVVVDNGHGPRTVRFPRDGFLAGVLRDVPTAEEVAAKAEADRQVRLDWTLADAWKSAQKAYARVEKTTAELAHAADYRIDSQWSYLSAHLEALAERDIWAEVLYAVGNTYGEHSTKCGQRVTFADAIVDEAIRLREALIGNRWSGSSSSDVSNTCERARAAAASKWLRSYVVVGLSAYAAEGSR